MSDMASNGVSSTSGPPPRRPQSAYNVYYQMERQRILQELDRGEDPYDTTLEKVPFTEEIVAEFIEQQRQKNNDSTQPKAKRKHVKSHGKISFIELARLAAKRWRSLPSIEKNVFNKCFDAEQVRYRQELEEWMKQNREVTEGSDCTKTDCEDYSSTLNYSKKFFDPKGQNAGNEPEGKSILNEHEEAMSINLTSSPENIAKSQHFKRKSDFDETDPTKRIRSLQQEVFYTQMQVEEQQKLIELMLLEQSIKNTQIHKNAALAQLESFRRSNMLNDNLHSNTASMFSDQNTARLLQVHENQRFPMNILGNTNTTMNYQETGLNSFSAANLSRRANYDSAIAIHNILKERSHQVSSSTTAEKPSPQRYAKSQIDLLRASTEMLGRPRLGQDVSFPSNDNNTNQPDAHISDRSLTEFMKASTFSRISSDSSMHQRQSLSHQVQDNRFETGFNQMATQPRSIAHYSNYALSPSRKLSLGVGQQTIQNVGHASLSERVASLKTATNNTSSQTDRTMSDFRKKPNGISLSQNSFQLRDHALPDLSPTDIDAMVNSMSYFYKGKSDELENDDDSLTRLTMALEWNQTFDDDDAELA